MLDYVEKIEVEHNTDIAELLLGDEREGYL